METDALIFFMLFAAALVAMYVGLRRHWMRPEILAALGTLASITMMVLSMLQNGASLIQAVFLGVLTGAIFSGATLALAWYFHSSEVRSEMRAEHANR